MNSIQTDYIAQAIKNVSSVAGIKSRTGIDDSASDALNASAFQASFSDLGKILASAVDSGSVEQSDISSFFDQLKKATTAGSVESLAANAPDWLKTAAEDTGVDLETALTDFMENAPLGPQGMGRPPERPAGPPPGMGNTQLGQLLQTAEESEDADQEDIRTYLDSLREAFESGSTDTAALAESAPDWLKTAAEKSGVDLQNSLDAFLSGLPGNDGFSRTS